MRWRARGAELARLELTVALPALARRFPELRAAAAPVYRQKSLVFGVEQMSVHLGQDALTTAR